MSSSSDFRFNNLLTFLQCYVSFELDHYVSELLTMFHCVGSREHLPLKPWLLPQILGVAQYLKNRIYNRIN